VFQDILEKIREYQSDLVVLVPDGNTSWWQRVAYRIEEEGANIVIKIPMEQWSEYVFSVYGQDDKFIKELEVFWERFKRVYIWIRTQVNWARQYGTEQSRIRNQTKRKK
jgi:hypothetical protein